MIPKRNRAITLPAATLSAKPVPIPIAVTRKLSAITPATSCPADAPRAIRSAELAGPPAPVKSHHRVLADRRDDQRAAGKQRQQRRQDPERRGLTGDPALERAQAGDRDPAVGLPQAPCDGRRDRLETATVPEVERRFPRRGGPFDRREEDVAWAALSCAATEECVLDDPDDFRPSRLLDGARQQRLADCRLAGPQRFGEMSRDDRRPAGRVAGRL